MNRDRCKLNNNYYTTIDHTKIYVNYHNKHIRIINFNTISVQNLKKIIHFASKEYLSKVICNCDIKFFEYFVDVGFQLEGKIDSYFKGRDAFIMSYFISINKIKHSNHENRELLLKQNLNTKNKFVYNVNNLKYFIRDANKNDIKQMIALFSKCSSLIYNEEYLKKTMNETVLYKVAVDNDKIICIASANMDKKNLNAEITTCITDPNYMDKGILSDIIHFLELDLKRKKFITVYSLSRAINPTINFVLNKHNYKFRGRLINNCNIYGNFEDMNIWVKIINCDLNHSI